MVAATASLVYEPSPIKLRRTKAEMGVIRQACVDILTDDNPMTVRQLYYQLVSRGVIAKTEGEYKATVVRLLTELRRTGEIPFDWIADNTRWMRKPATYSSIEQFLRHTARTYRRAVWDDADAYVEVWLEKDALAGVLIDVTAEYDVPLMVTRGYPSVSYLHSAAEAIADRDVPAYLYYLGDYDPSGMDITRATEAGLREFAPEAEIYFERVAVTPAQIRDLNLMTRPTKATDSRSKKFDGESVEVDAIPARTLKQIVHDCIEQHIDQTALSSLKLAEESERTILYAMAREVS